MFTRWLISFGRALCLAAVPLSLLAPLAGCALWSKDVWSLDRYRDERAVDIDNRLSDDKPIIKNPF